MFVYPMYTCICLNIPITIINFSEEEESKLTIVVYLGHQVLAPQALWLGLFGKRRGFSDVDLTAHDDWMICMLSLILR